MKIIESEVKISENLKTWISELTCQDLDSFLQTISGFHNWEFEVLEDLIALAPLLNKIDSFFEASVSDPNSQALDLLLTFSIKIVTAAHFKGHYGSIPELVALLNTSSWRTCKNTLKLINLVIIDIKIESIDNSVLSVLDQKAFSLFICGFLEKSHSLTLKHLLTTSNIPKASQKLPIGLKPPLIPFYSNLVTKYNTSLSDPTEKVEIVCCKLVAAKTLIACSRLKVFLSHCSANDQENWIFSGLEELINLNLSSEISAECLGLIGKLTKELVQDKKIKWPTMFNFNKLEQNRLWSRLVIQILNSVSSPNSYYPEDDCFVLNLLELIPVFSMLTYHEHSADYQYFTISLINLIKKKSCAEYKSQYIIYQALKYLASLMNKSIKYFKDNDGLPTIIAMLKSLIKTEQSNPQPSPQNSKLLKNTLKFLKKLVEKWEEAFNGLDEMAPIIIETGLIECFIEIFKNKLSDFFEEVLTVVFPITQVSISPEFNRLFFDLASAVLLASDSSFPSTVKQADLLARFLCSIPQGNNELISILEEFQILARIIFIIGTGTISIQALQNSTNIAENLQELVISLPECRNQAVEGIVRLLKHLVSQSENENFAIQVANVGGILCTLMINNTDLIRKLLDSRVIELIFEVFHVKFRPTGISNDLYKLNMFFKVVPDGAVTNIFKKIFMEIQSAQEKIFYYIEIDSCIRPFEAEDFYDQVLLIDCYIDSLRTIIQKNSSLPVNFKDLSDLLAKLAVIQRFFIKIQSSKLLFKDNPPVFSFSNAPELNVIENQESKSPEENWLFMCQLSIRKLFRSIVKVPNNRGKQELTLEYCLSIGKIMGQILIDSLKSMNFSSFTHTTGYYYSLLLSDFIKIMYNEQNPSSLFLLGFILEDGISSLITLLTDLQSYSQSLSPSFPHDFHLINSVQILWSLCGRLLENFISEKFSNFNLGSNILKLFGYSSSKDVVRKMKEIVVQCLNAVGYMDPGVFSCGFAKSVLAILKYLTSCNKDISVVDPQCLNMLVNMGFNRQVARQALISVRRNSVETATEWIFTHPEALNVSSEEFCGDQVLTEHIFMQILAAIPLIPSLSSLIADCLAQISVSNEDISQKITMKLVNMVGQIVAILGGYTGLVNEEDSIEKDVSWEQLDAYTQVLQIISQKNQQVFDHILKMNFSLHGFRILSESPIDHLSDKWVLNLLILLDYIGKSGQEICEEIIKILIYLLKTHNEHLVFNSSELNSIISIANNFLIKMQIAEYFVMNSGVQELFLLRSPKENCDLICQNKIWVNLIVKLTKDPKVIFSCFQSKILKRVKNGMKLVDYLKECNKNIFKSHELFFMALKTVLNFSKNDGVVFVSAKKNIDCPNVGTWESMGILCNCISELFYSDIQHLKKYILNTNNLLEFLSLALETCPLLVGPLLSVDFQIYCPFKQAQVNGSFIENLIKVIIPFRYELNFNKMVYCIPTTEVLLPQATNEHWISICVRLLSQLCLHRVQKYHEKANKAEETSLESALNSVTHLFLSLLSDSTQSNWYQSNYSKAINSIIPSVLSDLLLVPCPNEKKSTCNCLILARSLSSQSSGLISSLFFSFSTLNNEACPKTLLKQLLRLTELLLRYNLNSTLQNNENWELLRSSEFIQFKEHFNHREIEPEAESLPGEYDENQNFFNDFSEDEGYVSQRNNERSNEREVFESLPPQHAGRVFSGNIFEEGLTRRAFFMNLDENQMMDIIMNRGRPPATIEALPDRHIRRTYPESPEKIHNFIQEVQESTMETIPQSEPEEKIPERDSSIDPEFLAALPEEIRNEVLASYTQPEAISQNLLLRSNEMETLSFLNTLSPDLRREVLATASEEVINSLPEDLANEAYNIQQRFRIRPRLSQRVGLSGQTRKNHPTGLEIFTDLEKPSDKNSKIQSFELAMHIYRPPPEVFLSLFKGFSDGVLCNKLFSLVLLSLSAHPQNLEEIAKALILMIRPESAENYKENFKEISENSINTLLFLAKYNSNLKFILAYDLFSQFQNVIELVDDEQFALRPNSLCVLLKLVCRVLMFVEGNLVRIEPGPLSKLTRALKIENLNEKALKKLVKILNVISQNPDIKGNLLLELENSLCDACEEIRSKLTPELVMSISKESQVFRLCEVLKNISGSSSVISTLWDPLSDCISKLPSQSGIEDQMLKKLLPLIQAFFISHTSQEQPKSFWHFTKLCSKQINHLIHRNFNLLEGPLKMLITDFSFILDFENKRQYFTDKLKEHKRGKPYGSLRLNVRRTDVFTDSFHQLKGKTPEEMQSKLRVQFAKEDGIDAGGLAREWFGLLSREMFNPNYALFIPSPNGATFQPNSMSHVNQDHLQFFKFVGRIVGKAICDGFTLDVYFTRSFYKHILGQEISYQDMEDIDVGFYKNLKSLVDINLNDSDLHEYYFCYEEQEFGTVTVKELLPGGSSIKVTENNKLEYIKLLCHMKMTKNIQAQLQAFKDGFYEMISPQLISIFSSKELELLISGLPTFDIIDLKKNTEYYNYTKDSPVVVWFWKTLEDFSEEEKAEFLQFVTGSSKVPIEGFKALPGMDGPQKFQIHKSFASKERLPTAHTCINQLDLPEYSCEEDLRNKLKLAIREGNEGFGFA